MTRVTRSRQDPATLNKESELKVNSKASAVKNVTRSKNTKSKSINKNKLEQDENAVPSTKTRKVQSRIKNTKSNILASKLHSTSRISTSENKNTTLALKSPVLRDRTNTTNELTKFVSHPKETVKEQSIDLKKTAKKAATGKVVRKKNKAKETQVKAKNLDDKVASQIERVPSDSPKQNGDKTPKPLAKRLRQRGIKDYCEISQISRESDTAKREQKNEENPVKKDSKGVPIYKTIRLSQEEVDNKEEIYEFPEESQEEGQKSRKRRKVKRPVVKRAKKVAPAQCSVPKRVQKKTVKKVQKVQFELQTDHQEPIDPVDFVIPEHLQNAGNSTIAEASTIKILSNEKLEGSKRISLTATPPIPKTINSELKLFGPKNAITCEPTSQYSNMVNHSLIRKSMSPITKLIDNFDTGSPWRPVETFSRIQKVVQSTPQINKVTLMRDKKSQPCMMKLDEKSICSQDTIHLSSNTSRLQNKENQPGMVSPKEATEVSPRKFGTVISNSSPEQAKTTENMNSTSPSKKIQQSSVQLASPKPLTEVPADVGDASAFKNMKNMLISPQVSPRKKFSTPSPFRFEKLRTSNRISTIGPRAESHNASLQTREEFDPEAGPSWLDKPNPSVLKQSNLNRFLNLNDMPKSTCISTPHGIFNDMNSTPINGKKSRKLIEEANIDNAFGFDDCSINDVSSILENTSTAKIATEKDVKASKKGKIFPNARVKSTLSSRISENTVKRTLLRNTKTKIEDKKVPEILGEHEKNSSSGDENEKNSSSGEENEKNEDTYIAFQKNTQQEYKTTVTDSISFLDTFDVLSENQKELESEAPKEIPLFADLEPVHFSQPPRRSYIKRKRVCFDTVKHNSKDNKANFLSDEDEDEDEENKPKKKKKMSKVSREEQKQMHEWIKNINKTFEEVEHFDLIVE